jgi:hypothetical protein
MSRDIKMEPVKCGFCRRAKATALLTLNDNPVFACESCIAGVEREVEARNAILRSRTTTGGA